MTRYEAIETEVKALSALVEEIAVVDVAGIRTAYIYPNFEAARQQGIVNLTQEIRWYAVELYNMHAEESEKIRAYHVVPRPLPKDDSGIDLEGLEAYMSDLDAPKPVELDIDDAIYHALKEELERLSGKPVYPSSHFEFDLDLDSFDHVELYAFIEASFGVEIHDKTFATMMTPELLYQHVKAHKLRQHPQAVHWSQLLRAKGEMALLHSPWVLRFYKALALPLFKLYFRLGCSGMEHIPETPCIIAPSHQSMLDGFIITAALPWRILPKTFTLAFDQVFGVTPVAKYGQLILIDVNNDLKASMQRAAVPLIQQQDLVIFPEGARSRDRELLEFRPFFALLAKEFNVPIVPTVLDGTFEALRAGMSVPRPAKVVVKYLEPIYPSEDESAEVLAQRVKRAIKEEMEAHPLV